MTLNLLSKRYYFQPMEFRTKLLVKPIHSIALSDTLLTIGSCFADDIGSRLQENKFKVLKNPFGTVYNPLSIHNLLNLAIEMQSPSTENFVERDGYFYHYDFNSHGYNRSQELLKEKLETQLKGGYDALAKSNYLIITYGTSWVYENKETKNTVANCHKMAQHNFEKFLLTQKRIVESFESMYAKLKKLNPACQIILTVSPVRHIKDSLELNSVSKSILRLTCHTLTELFQDVAYFPAYEIMMDDLRDYRFYKPDMLHPSDQAIEYVWEKFGDAFFNSDVKNFIEQWGEIQAALNHKPFNPKSKKHQDFLKNLLEKLYEFRGKVDVDKEMEIARKQLEK